MRLRTLEFFLCACLLHSTSWAQDFPKAQISNGLVHADVMLPDPQNGSYRSTRFDWAGIISSLQFDGHEYFGQWYKHHDPKIHDAITGPVEEFRASEKDAGLDYAQTGPGGAFVRIGIGTVRKPEGEKDYRAYETYDIVDSGKWTIRKHADRIEFTHQLRAQDGYAYVYKKTLRLVKGKPELRIEHSLKNTGSQTIDTAQYNHNFFVIDHEVVGPDVVLKFPFIPEFSRDQGGRAEVHDQEIIFPQELKEKGVFSEIAGVGTGVNEYDFRIENIKTGAGVHITSNEPLLKVNYWAIRTVAVAEPYISVHIAPGAELHWTVRYDFYTLPPSTKAAAGN
jgi:hypothetical protein